MALSDKNIAQLCSGLELPLVAGEAISDARTLAPDEEFAFHEAMSDMEPDAALLCMALVCEQIAMDFAPDMPEASNVVMEADKIVARYGGLWLARMENGSPVPEAFIIEALKSLPSDMTILKEAMSELELQMPAGSEASIQFLIIMQIQAQSQLMIAETVLESLGIRPALKHKNKYLPIGATANDNVSVTPLSP